MRVRAAYTQWAAGQGFFHSGWIRAEEPRGPEVVHVFDCGAHWAFCAALDREIDQFRERHDHIDLLFISHFHLDHVSGLEGLLAGRPARRIVAPLLEPEERLLAFALALDHGLVRMTGQLGTLALSQT